MALAIFSLRFTEMLTDGCETPSFLDSLAALWPNLLSAQWPIKPRALTVILAGGLKKCLFRHRPGMLCGLL